MGHRRSKSGAGVGPAVVPRLPSARSEPPAGVWITARRSHVVYARGRRTSARTASNHLPVTNALSTISLSLVLSDPVGAPLTIGREAATELGLAALEHLEGAASAADARSLATYASRHEESAPARDALVGVLLNASGTLGGALASAARDAVIGADWGPGRESPALRSDPQVGAVPRRQALTERLLAERARRIRPRMHAFVTSILAQGAEAGAVPSWFLERNWLDLRDTLIQRGRNEPLRREAIAEWLAGQPSTVRARLHAVEEALIDIATHEILQVPQRAPLAPYCGTATVAERVRTAVGYRGDPARVRLAGYLERLPPGTPWYETIREIVER